MGWADMGMMGLRNWRQALCDHYQRRDLSCLCRPPALISSPKLPVKCPGALGRAEELAVARQCRQCEMRWQGHRGQSEALEAFPARGFALGLGGA